MEIAGWIRPPGGLVDIAFLFAMNSPFGGGPGFEFFEAASIFLPSEVDCEVGLDCPVGFDGAEDLFCAVLAAAAASDGEGSNAEPFNIAPNPPSLTAETVSAKAQYIHRSEGHTISRKNFAP